MKIKAASWVLGGAYLLCAVVFFLVMSKCRVAFAEQGIVLPTPSKAAFAIGPLGWLLVTVAIGSMAVLKDLAFPWRGWNFAFSIVLLTMVFFVAFAMIVPTIPVQAESVPANPRASLDVAIAFSLFFGRHRRRDSKPEFLTTTGTGQ
jgi:hypothetical protein